MTKLVRLDLKQLDKIKKIMGAGAINPFYNPRQSTPMSHFVDESLPIDLLLKAGVAKQGQYDQTQAGIDLLGSFDQDALKGRDTEYVDSVKEDVSKFVDSTLGKDLADSSIAREAFRFATKIQQDKKLKIARENLAAVQKLKEEAAELRKKKELFTPSYATAIQQISNYTNTAGEVSSIGDLFVEKELDRRKAREAFFNNASASFHEGFKNIEGLIMKVGVGGIDTAQIQSLANLGFSDYLASNAGQQDVDYYDYLVKTGQTPTDRFGKPITDGSRYVLDQMVRTGLERVHNKSTISFNKGLNELSGKPKNPQDGVITRTQSGTLEDTSYWDLIDLASEGKGNASVQAQSLLAQIHDKMDKDPTISGSRDKIKAITTGKAVLNKDGSVREKPSQGGMTLAREGAFDGAFDHIKLNGKDNVKKLENYVKNNIYKLIEKEASAGNTEFFDNLTFDSSENYGFPTTGSALFGNVAEVTEEGIAFRGSSEVFRWNEMGIDTKSKEGMQFIADAMGPHYGGPLDTKQPNKVARAIGDVLNSYVDEKGSAVDKTMAYSDDALDYIKNIAYDIAKKRDELSDGTVVTPQKVWMPTDPKAADDISDVLGRDNFDAEFTVFEISDEGLPVMLSPTDDGYKAFRKGVANKNKFTTRIGVEGDKFLEVTTSPQYTEHGTLIKNSVKKYQIQENSNEASGVMKYLYDSYLGQGTYDEASAIQGLQTLTDNSKSVLNIRGFNRLFDANESAEIENKGIGLKINDFRGYTSYSNPATPSMFTYSQSKIPVSIGKVMKDMKGAQMKPKNADMFARIFAHNLSYTRPKALEGENTRNMYLPPTDSNPDGGQVYQILNKFFSGTTLTNSEKELASAIKNRPILGYNDVNETKNLTLLLAGILKID